MHGAVPPVLRQADEFKLIGREGHTAVTVQVAGAALEQLPKGCLGRRRVRGVLVVGNDRLEKADGLASLVAKVTCAGSAGSSMLTSSL